MTTHLHTLNGCSPVPLANYLKALGILRLVSEQADKQARGWWAGERFCLLTQLSKEELESFFLEKYEPTPLLSPWNAGSGFYRTWDTKKNKLRNSKNAQALDKLIEKGGNRIELIRAAVDEIRQVLPNYCPRVDVMRITDKERGKLLILPEGDGPVFPVISKDDSGKSQVQQVLLRFSHSTPFYRSALVEVGEEIKYPWLWGSGGNDGGIDYTGRFFENLSLVLNPTDPQLNTQLLRNSLFGEHATGYLTKASGKVGQFFPSAAGGANVTTGPGSQHDTHLNPWDFVLLLEGAILFSSRTTRRLDPRDVNRASAPFAVKSHAAGFASPGSEKAQRGEQWMPLWKQPATLGEVTALYGEARVQLDRQTANRPVDVARAINRLGVARGVEAFVRYGYLERNGQSTLAVPLGRVNVPKQQNPRVYLIDDIANWMNSIERSSRNKNAPAKLAQAERRLADAGFAALTHDHGPERWQAILLAAADIEMLQATGTAIEAGPIPSLRAEWASPDVVGDTPDVRLARALGSAASDYFKGRPIDPVRHHWLPLESGARRFKTSDKRLVNDPRVIAFGRDPIRDLAALVDRRLIEAGMDGERSSRLIAAPGCGARLDDLALLLNGSLNFDRILGLARAFMAVRWDQWKKDQMPRAASSSSMPDEAWLAVRLANLPSKWINDQHIPAGPRIVRQLMAGDATRAIDIACQRLRSAGIRPPLQAGVTDAASARLWAAALAFPIDWKTTNEVAERLDPRLKSQKGLQHV